MRKFLLSILASSLLCSSAWASGYQVLLQSNRSAAMGNIGVGLRPDPSSINFNPGAIALMRSNGIQVGANLIYSNVLYQPFDSREVYQTDNPVGTPFHVFAAFGPEDSNLKFGLGIYTPFGSTVEWEDNWVGRFELTSLSLQAIFVQPTVSYAFSDKFSIGAGFIYSFGGVNLQRDISAIYFGGNEYGSVELDGSASGFGYNLGLYFEPSEKVSIGLNYRSRIDMKVDEGTANFRKSSLIPDSQIPGQTSFTAELPLPSNLTLGVSFRPTDKFMIGADIMRTGWSAYESLTFVYADAVNGSDRTSAARNYESSFTYRLGAEYQVLDVLKLRAGAYYDETPVLPGYMTPETPDANAIGYSAGFVLNLGENLEIDAAFLLIDKEQRDNPAIEEVANLTGTYKARAIAPGLSFTYKF